MTQPSGVAYIPSRTNCSTDFLNPYFQKKCNPYVSTSFTLNLGKPSFVRAV